MSYFHLVPPTLYQTQQKLKKNALERKAREEKIEEEKKSHSAQDGPPLRGTVGSSVPSDKKGLAHGVDAADLKKSLSQVKKSSSIFSFASRPKKSRVSTSGTNSPSTLRKDNESICSNETTSARNNSTMSYNSFSSSGTSSRTENRHESLQTNKSSLSESYTAGDEVYRNSFFSKLQFELVTDPAVMNSSYSLEKAVHNLQFQETKYIHFLDMLSVQRNDPISFASVRHHSLHRFIQSYSQHRVLSGDDIIKDVGDERYYETILGSLLLSARKHIRQYMRSNPSAEYKDKSADCEELIQLNTSKYVRHVFCLPDEAELPIPVEELDETLATHYFFRRAFLKVGQALYNLNKEGAGESGTDKAAGIIECVLLSLRKTTLEFILLEKYCICILSKLCNDSLIESRVLKNLFRLFIKRLKVKDTESVKVLHYNLHYSSQYSWYMAITVPFVRVIEMNIQSERSELVNDINAYREHLTKTYKTSLKEQDIYLFNNYFKSLGLDDYSNYRSLSLERLVKMLRTINETVSQYETLKFKDRKYHASLSGQKPMNFEYYSNSLSSVEFETFDLIQSRDLLLQLTPKNYTTVLREFYRILKKGGVLEIPYIQPSFYPKNPDNSGIGDFPNSYDFMGYDLRERLDIIPNCTAALLEELNSIFGEGNVTYSMSISNCVNEVNSFLIKILSFSFHEMAGRVEQFYSDYFKDECNHVEDDEKLYFYIYIKAAKT